MTNPKHTDTSNMTEAEALDEAAKAAGWPNGWGEASRFAPNNLFNAIRAHAATIMENAENARLLSMSAEREINLRGELLRLQRKNAALNAENERLTAILSDMNGTDIVARTMANLAVAREALEKLSSGAWIICRDDPLDVRTIARAALKEIEGDR